MSHEFTSKEVVKVCGTFANIRGRPGPSNCDVPKETRRPKGPGTSRPKKKIIKIT